jgi:hypothetical protein
MDARPPSPPATPAATTHWLDRPANVRRLWRGFLLVLALTVLAEAAITLHPHFAVESIFGFAAWFGFAACAAMIFAAKGLALWLKRPERYYGDGREQGGDD